MQVPLLDLKIQYRQIRREVMQATEAVYESQAFILGEPVAALEAQIAAYCGSPHAVGVSSGTDALLMALTAAGIGPGDWVLTTPYTFFSTGGSIARLGARPLFCDIDPETYNLSPACMSAVIDGLSSADRKRLKAVIPVHLYGQCADMHGIQDVAHAYDLTVIEDAAQAIGAEFDGRRAGALGDMGCFSFFPSKNLGAFGDGGMVTCVSQSMDELLRKLRMHGAHPKYYHEMIGGNFRLDALQAAIVSVKLRYLDEWIRKRRENAARYRLLCREAGLEPHMDLPCEKTGRHVYNQFVVRVPGRRDALRRFLTEAGVGTEIYYPLPLHLQACFADLGGCRGDFPASEAAAEQTLALPVYPELTEAQQTYVVDRMAAFFRR